METERIWCPACERFHPNDIEHLEGDALGELQRQLDEAAREARAAGARCRCPDWCKHKDAHTVQEVIEPHPPLVDIKISTRKPGKWLFIDTEDESVWRWDDGCFKRAGCFTGNFPSSDMPGWSILSLLVRHVRRAVRADARGHRRDQSDDARRDDQASQGEDG